jgi:hypothetical protein
MENLNRSKLCITSGSTRPPSLSAIGLGGLPGKAGNEIGQAISVWCFLAFEFYFWIFGFVKGILHSGGVAS